MRINNLSNSLMSPIEQIDNPVAIELVRLTKMRMVCVSQFWMKLIAREQEIKLYKLASFKEIQERVPILASNRSTPHEVFIVLHRVHEEIIMLLKQLPESKQDFFQTISSKDIINCPQHFLQLVKDVPPPQSFYKEVLHRPMEWIIHKIDNMDVSFVDEDGNLPIPPIFDSCVIF